MCTFRKYPGAAPPRALAAVAATVATLLLHGTVLGLFRQATAEAWLLATPALERQLARCRTAVPGDRQRCALAVQARAREATHLTQVAER